MLRDLQNYVGDQTEITAQDMNTLGQLVRIVNGITGSNVFKDATGIAFRGQPAPTPPEDDLGERDGQVLQMTSQLEKGWADLRLVNRA